MEGGGNPNVCHGWMSLLAVARGLVFFKLSIAMATDEPNWWHYVREPHRTTHYTKPLTR